MNDLEERLRADLHSAVDGYQMEIDLDQVMAFGKGVRRAKAVRRLVAVAALVVALFGASVVAAPPIIAAILESQTVEVSSSFQWDKTRSEFDLVSVQLRRKGGVLKLVATGQRDGKEVATNTWELPKDITTPIRFALSPRAVIGVFPGQIEKAELVYGLEGSGGGSEWMPAFGVTVVVRQLEKAVAHPEAMDWVWVNAAGSVGASEGVAAAKVNLGGTDYVVYRSEKADVLGVLGGLGGFSFKLSDYKDSDLLDGAVAWGDPTTGVSWQLGSLPAGAHDVQLKLSKPGGEWAAVALSDGSTIVVATVPGHPDQVVTSMHYLRADGTEVRIGR